MEEGMVKEFDTENSPSAEIFPSIREKEAFFRALSAEELAKHKDSSVLACDLTANKIILGDTSHLKLTEEMRRRGGQYFTVANPVFRDRFYRNR
jgi:hypothetical protein